MSRRPRRNHTLGFKAKVALAAIKGDRTITQLAEHFDVHPNQITTWKAQLERAASGVFGPGGAAPAEPAVDVKSLHAKIGELTQRMIPKKRQHLFSAPRAGEQSRRPLHADANC